MPKGVPVRETKFCKFCCTCNIGNILFGFNGASLFFMLKGFRVSSHIMRILFLFLGSILGFDVKTVILTEKVGKYCTCINPILKEMLVHTVSAFRSSSTGPI